MDADRLLGIAQEVRAKVVRMAADARSSHVGAGLSSVDILVMLYFEIMNVDPMHPDDAARDIFLLSKGHGCAALYAVLATAGFFPEERLTEYYQDGGKLPGHPVYRSVPGVEATTGSLGHGLALGLGQAVGKRLKRERGSCYVLLGDGECNEGSVWEAAMVAAQLQLSNLVAIVDNNDLQGFGRVGEISGLQPLAQKWASFGWDVRECDGHDFADLHGCLCAGGERSERPLALIARTVKGKGVSYMEDRLEWHYKSPTAAQLDQALQELQP